jgi:hypothetical protein
VIVAAVTLQPSFATGCSRPVMSKSVSRCLAAAIDSAALLPTLLPPAIAATDSTEPDVPVGDMGSMCRTVRFAARCTFSIDSTRDKPGKLTCVLSALKTGAPEPSARCDAHAQSREPNCAALGWLRTGRSLSKPRIRTTRSSNSRRNGPVVETAFRRHDFNVCPPPNRTRYLYIPGFRYRIKAGYQNPYRDALRLTEMLPI